MIVQDHEREFDQFLAYLEYHASFTNAEGVEQVKKKRKERENDSSEDAEKFIEEAKTNDFKNNPLIEAIKKLRQAANPSSVKETPANSINLNSLLKERF